MIDYNFFAFSQAAPNAALRNIRWELYISGKKCNEIAACIVKEWDKNVYYIHRDNGLTIAVENDFEAAKEACIINYLSIYGMNINKISPLQTIVVNKIIIRLTSFHEWNSSNKYSAKLIHNGEIKDEYRIHFFDECDYRLERPNRIIFSGTYLTLETAFHSLAMVYINDLTGIDFDIFKRYKKTKC